MDSSPVTFSSSFIPHFNPLTLRLDRNNYQYWHAQVLSTVRAHGFEGFLFGSTSQPPQFLPSSSTSSSVSNPEYVTWMRRDQFLLSWMLSSISESMLGHFNRCHTSQDVWTVLEQLFQTQSKARTMQLRFMLQTIKKGDLTVDAYILKMKEIADTLSAIGHSISDDELALYILAGFGPEYDSVVVNLTSRSDSLSLQEVQFALQTHELRLQNQVFSTPLTLHTSVTNTHPSTTTEFSHSPSANVTYSRNPTSFNSGFRGGGRSYRGRGRGGRFYRGNHNKHICQLCGRSGHIALKCYKRFDVSFTGQDSNASNTGVFGSSGSVFPQALVAAATPTSAPDPNWYFDSGSTNHVTADLENLSLKSDYQGSDKLAVGQIYQSSPAGRST